mgnify:CR=1 FL=1
MPRYFNIDGQSVQFSVDEEAARDAEEATWAAGANDRQADEVRRDRDAKLAATDWMANSDVSMSDEWRTYRQALRDVPNQLPGDVTWPTAPDA